MRAQPVASAVNSHGIAPSTQTSDPFPNMVTMSSVLKSSLTEAAAKLGKENPSRAGLMPLVTEVSVTFRMSGALGSTGAELPPEQAEATIATVAMTAKKRCRNPIGFTLLHILSNYGSGALEHWVSGEFGPKNRTRDRERAEPIGRRFLLGSRLPIESQNTASESTSVRFAECEVTTF